MKKKEVAFENNYVKIMKPTREIEKEIVNILKENNSKENGDSISAYYILNKLSIPKDEEYDFSKYSVEEFIEIEKEAHLYDGLQEIISAAALVSWDVVLHNLQYTAMGLKKQRVEALIQIIKEESEGLGLVAKELYYAEKEKKKTQELADVYREKRMMQREVEKLSFNEAE